MQPLNPISRWQIGLILTIGVIAISTAAVLVRLTIAAANMSGVGFSLVMAASRLAIASLILLPTWHTLSARKHTKTAWYCAIAAGLALALHFATWITSLSYTSIAASTAIVTTNPIWVALLSWLWFKEKTSRQTLLGIGLALMGGLLICLGDIGGSRPSNPLLGNGLALVGAWASSGYILLGRAAQHHGFRIGEYAAVAYTTAAIALLPLPLLLGYGYTNYPPIVYGYLILMALVPQVIGHTSFNWAVRWVSPTLLTLVILLEPIFASILGYFLFAEIPGTLMLMGTLVLLVGVAIAVMD
ncbi:DMT family transporter [Phormidium sp. CLA17]|uniref:DMT family transporter n=1 Tax=Leptolyngbya sp. Cla-17 TaxID=2803751 RepID=UPI001491D6CC|nr:DMT family transporter [Leptolyngbya sp. Cla-17]MBM0741678.1 DMT family transporter [Leptolyngbya sp. Cla-17]